MSSYYGVGDYNNFKEFLNDRGYDITLKYGERIIEYPLPEDVDFDDTEPFVIKLFCTDKINRYSCVRLITGECSKLRKALESIIEEFEEETGVEYD